MADTPEVPSPADARADADSALAGLTAAVAIAEERLAVILTTQKAAETALTEAQGKLAEIVALSAHLAAAKVQASDAQAVISVKSQHIQDAQEHADKVRADLDRVLTSATQQATAAEGQKTSAETAAQAAAALVVEIRASKAVVDKEELSATSARETAEEDAGVTSKLAEKSAEIERRIAAYEEDLTKLGLQCDAHLKTIVKLLPGATTAGLAFSFDERRQTFLKPATRWQWVFVSSVGAIVLLTVLALWQTFLHGGTAPSYDELFRMWLTRLPVMAALVWLALHSSQEAALAKRLEEDYGYKAAIASCFEGFKKQMSDVGEVEEGSALDKLLENTLATIASPPGRIYESHKLSASPADHLKQAAESAANFVQSVKK